MERYGRSSAHNFSLIEVVVFILAIGLIILIAGPKVLSFASKIKMDNAMDSVYSYKDSVNNYYVSRLMIDSSFKLDGRYTVSDGNLVDNDDVYKLFLTGNVPTDGYLDYENNILKSGCVIVDGYFVEIVDGNVSSVSTSDCMIHEDMVDVVLSEI